MDRIRGQQQIILYILFILSEPLTSARNRLKAELRTIEDPGQSAAPRFVVPPLRGIDRFRGTIIEHARRSAP